jgi:hypothetical protein
MHEIACLEAQALLVWIYMVFEKIHERNNSCHICQQLTAIYSQPFNNINDVLP